MHFRMNLDTAIGICAAIQKDLDEIECAVGTWSGYRGRQGIAIGDSQIKRRPTLRVRLVRIGSVVEQKLCNVVVTVLNRNQQRTAAIHGCFIYIRSGSDQHAHCLDSAFSSRE